MKKLFCPYCGLPLSEGCDCEMIAAEKAERFLDDYYNDPLVNEGWAQQDLIDMYRMER